jgi:peptidoglycan/xylan/chitin deacetylase (PgdA/CDA1 family)
VACGGTTGAITRDVAGTTTTVTTTTAEPATTVTTAAPDTTAPAATSAPTTAPVLGQGEGDVMAPPPPGLVRPAPGWIGFGIPQAGSMFENLRLDHSLDGKGQFVALTFDDGPSQYTVPIVNILRFFGVAATFFQITSQSREHPDLVRLMHAGGAHIGAHTEHHPRLTEISPDQQNVEVAGSIDALNGILGPGSVMCFRPPYARYDQHVLDLAATHQTAVAMWSFDTLDWKQPPWQSIAQRVVRDAKDRDVILMHDGGGNRTNTIEALPWIIQGLRNRGFQFIQVC